MMIFLAGVLSGLFFSHPDLFRGADMDIILSLLFCLEAAFGYWLLYRSGVLNRTFLILLSAAMLALLPAMGYELCGTVSYGPRGERIAFEKAVAH